MQHKANFLNNSLFSLLLLGLLGITSCNTVTRLNVKKDDGNALAPQHRGVSIDFEKKEEPNDPYAELRSAVINSRIDEVKRLIHKGVKAKHGPTGSTLLHDLARTSNWDSVLFVQDKKKSKCVEILNILVEKGVDINAKDKSGWTPLHTAVANKNDALVKALISNGADLTIKDESGWTPLHTAVANKNDALVKALISSGADLTIKDSINKTAYEIAEENKDEAVMNLFHESLKGTKWERELHDEVGKLELALDNIKRLIRMGVYIDPEFCRRRNPNFCRALERELHYAVSKREPALDDIKFLIRIGVDRIGVDIDSKDRSGNTALHRVSERGHADVVKLLTDGGAKVGVRNVLGKTPLHLAADAGYDKVVAILSNKAASQDVNNAYKIAKSNLEEPPAPLTKEEKEAYEDIIRLLKKNGANTAERKGR